jgi:hypothetical protein
MLPSNKLDCHLLLPISLAQMIFLELTTQYLPSIISDTKFHTNINDG